MRIKESGLLGLRKAVIITVCVIAIVISALYFSNISGWWNTTSKSTSSTSTWTSPTTTTNTLTTPAYFKIFGLVSTTGNGTEDTAVVFTSSSGKRYVATITNGSFFIELPNLNTYNATTVWKGSYSWQNGTIYRGQLFLNAAPGSKAAQSFNIQDETPNSLITVSGVITLKGHTANPVMIRFNATYGQTFEALVNNGTYSINLPNIMEYTISVKLEDTAGNFGWSDAGSLTVQASPGTMAQTLDIWSTSTLTPHQD